MKAFLKMYIFCFVIWVMMNAVSVQGDPTPQWLWEDNETTQIESLTINAAGTMLAVGTRMGPNGKGIFAVFDWRYPEPIMREEYADTTVSGVALSEDGVWAACNAGDTLYLYEIPGILKMQFTDTDGNLRDVGFSGDGSLLYASRYLDSMLTEGGAVHLFDVDNLELLWTDVLGDHLEFAPRLRVTKISDDGSRILCTFQTGMMGEPVYAALYQTDSATPDDPVWITPPIEPSYVPESDFAGDGENFVLGSAVYVRYYDMEPPSGGVKDPIWTETAGGHYTLMHKVSISRDGNTVGHFGPYSDLAGDIVPGSVEVYDDEGNLKFHTETYYKWPEGDVSGDGSRVAFSSLKTEQAVEPNSYVMGVEEEEIIWSGPGIGKVIMDETGESILMGGGTYYDASYEQMLYYRLEDNEPPACEITSPEPGSSVGGCVTVQGTSEDLDGTVLFVELYMPDGNQTADPVGSSYDLWTAVLDFSSIPPGPFTLKARAVDENYKYGPWFDIEITVFEVTQTPTPQFTHTPTQENTPLPTCTPDPDDTLTIMLDMPAKLFRPGDTFRLDAHVWNPGPILTDMPLVVMLEIYDNLYFWPSWNCLEPDGAGFDFQLRDFPIGQTDCEIIQTFIWPQNAGEAYGILFYSALLSADFTSLISNMDFITWGFQE